MIIHHIRNATMVIEANGHFILVDPMLGQVGSMSSFTLVRAKAQKNPLVPIPECSREVLELVTHCLITHQHPDHIDKEGEKFLLERDIPVYCSIKDQKAFEKKGLHVIRAMNYWKRDDFLSGKIMGIPAKHGYGFAAKQMGNVMGFYIALPNQPAIYLSSDTIYTDDVEKVLTGYLPDISVVATGTAQLDVFKPLLMTIEDILKFVENAPGKVIANHMEALNHCQTSRTDLKHALIVHDLIDKVFIPEDGEKVEIK